MTDEHFKKAKNLVENIKQIDKDLVFLKKCYYCYINLSWFDSNNGHNISEITSIPMSVIKIFAFEYLTKERTNLKEQFKNL